MEMPCGGACLWWSMFVVDTQTLNVLHAGELLTILFVSLSTVLEGKQAIERSLHVYELCNIASAS